MPSSAYLVLPCSPPGLPFLGSPHICLQLGFPWGSLTPSPSKEAKSHFKPLHPLAPCSVFAALPAPRALWGWCKLCYLLTSLPAQLAFAFPAHPPPPGPHLELVVASAALSFGVSANCQDLPWHPISTIHTNDCEKRIHFHFLKGFHWLESSCRVRLGRVAGGQIFVLTEQSVTYHYRVLFPPAAQQLSGASEGFLSWQLSTRSGHCKVWAGSGRGEIASLLPFAWTEQLSSWTEQLSKAAISLWSVCSELNLWLHAQCGRARKQDAKSLWTVCMLWGE